MAKVLVVDDDLDVRESLSDWLEREHQVCQAAGVPEALAAMGRERPDVVITDFELPPYRGDDLLATLAEHYPNVGRIMHTGSPGRALGFAYSVAHRVLKKGCDLSELSRAIRDYLGSTKVTDAG
jgi:DNA-binding NtrC family response regulator